MRSGSSLNQLYHPHTVYFDSVGNLYVGDEWNFRVQIFRSKMSTCGCYPPIIKIILSGTVLRVRRNQYFYISSKIELRCNQSDSFSAQWSILNCPSPCFDERIDMYKNNLYIPSQTLPYGIYQFELIVKMTNFDAIKSSVFVDVEIIASSIIVHLVSYDTLIIKHHYEEDLVLNPGNYSYDQNSIHFNQHDWHYEYYCRIYSTNSQQFSTFENSNETCLLGGWTYNNVNRTAITIFSKAFQLNQTYQFMVQMTHRKNSSLQSFDYLIVQVENLQSPIIIIKCLIITMCSSKDEFRYVNRHTQISLCSFCTNNCSQTVKISWNIYQGILTSPNATIQWNSVILLPTSSFFGLDTKDLLIMSDILTSQYWRFEVLYQFESETIRSTCDVELNDGPRNGFCLIDPPNGTILTLFTINCSNWFDSDGIKDFLIYGLIVNLQKRILLTTSSNPIILLRLPANVHLIVQIRDTFDCTTEYDLPSITIDSNSAMIDTLLMQEHSNDDRYMIPMTLSKNLLTNNFDLNTVNRYATIREQFMMTINNLPLTTLNEIKFQSSILSILTETTNQLTRRTLIIALNKCSQLSSFHKVNVNKFLYEDTRFIATNILECVTNIHASINGPLQQRMQVLQSDLREIDDITLTEEHNLHHRNFEYQKQIANEMAHKINEILSLITLVLDTHLHLAQNFTINTSTISFLLAKISSSSVSDNYQIDYSSNSTLIIRTMMQPLASYGNSVQSYTNSSQLLSFSILDENQNDIRISRMEFFIPRDPNKLIPPMFFQNVTRMNENKLLFHFYSFELTKSNENQTFSIHFEIHPLNSNISYLLIYQFDHKPRIHSIQNWTYLCPSNSTADQTYLHFIDNSQTSNHHSIIYGIRELTFEEMNIYCSDKKFYQNLDQPRRFSSDYEIRLYQSSCLYLDSNNIWKSNGLLVGSSTTHNQTQCFLIHLT
ncbi:unnamed protein product [Adineta ricciae]|uniref:PKD/REJ-like domain-containing protein n=1 Tax=Adineta ricciae TaxID=249248 RepID=A0A815K6J0_ADIRI|nr:unnamed protein product [Adineta ricciae]CAF1518659.1 unnamed protein product [Adineta ricciae]